MDSNEYATILSDVPSSRGIGQRRQIIQKRSDYTGGKVLPSIYLTYWGLAVLSINCPQPGLEP
jgi:hypothetical protein